MDKKRRLSRLGGKLVGGSVLGLALAFAVFYLVNSAGVPWLLKNEYFASFWEARSDAFAEEYQAYVTENGLTVEEAGAAAERYRHGILYSYATVYVTDDVSMVQLITRDEHGAQGYRFGWPQEQENSAYFSIVSQLIADLYRIKCADGELYIATPSSAVQVENLGYLAGLLLALLAFCAVTVPCIIRLVRRVGALSQETGVLMAGDLDHVVHLEGRDELSGLGEDIERLRRSVLARLEGEREAVGANSRLITSLSHDIRTPLTKLTGYLDILTYGKYQGREEHDEFLRLASEKAAQLKALTDQLFASAQVAAPASGLEQPPEEVDGGALLGQLLTEQCDDLRREGFDIQPPVFDRAFTLYLRTEDAVRIFDNLFSNLRKYADPGSPVEIWWEDAPERVTLRLRNRARPAPDRGDSHGLGVPTMRELLERSGGTLEAGLEDGEYQSILTFRKHRESR